jgi:hypothetical protein
LQSALELRAVHTNTTFSIPYSSTTAPIFISYATDTAHVRDMYSSIPFAWNPVHKTVAIAGATSTASTYTGVAGTVPTTMTVTHFEYDFSESITKYNTMNILSSTITATHKGHLNITTNARTDSKGKVDIAWSTDGKYLAAVVSLNALTTEASALIIASMDTSTKILTSVASATFASENDSAYSVCWSGNSQVFIGGAYYSDGNYAGITYSFNTATDALTLETFPAGLTATPGAIGIDRLDNGELIFKIGGSQNQTSGLRIYNPTTSSTLTINARNIFSNITSSTTGVSHPIVGASYGSASHLHPIAYQHQGATGATNGLIGNTANTTGLSVFIYNSQTSTVSGLYSYTANTGGVWLRASISGKTKYGLITASLQTAGSPVNMINGNNSDNGLPSSARNVCIGDMDQLTSSSVFGPDQYIHPSLVQGSTKYLLDPGQTMIIPSRAGHFFGGTGSSYTFTTLLVQEVE